MKIISMRNVDWNNKIRAILTIKTSEGFEMKNFKLFEGDNGWFVSSPSIKGKDDKYYDTIWIAKELREELNKQAGETYNPQLKANEEYPEFQNSKMESDVPF
jgi:DNA-binding cell septation regulator SpoVG